MHIAWPLSYIGKIFSYFSFNHHFSLNIQLTFLMLRCNTDSLSYQQQQQWNDKYEEEKQNEHFDNVLIKMNIRSWFILFLLTFFHFQQNIHKTTIRKKELNQRKRKRKSNKQICLPWCYSLSSSLSMQSIRCLHKKGEVNNWRV